jgi:hypothetical protein
MPALPLQLPVTVQLQGSNASCWSAVFDAGLLENTDTAFSAQAN